MDKKVVGADDQPASTHPERKRSVRILAGLLLIAFPLGGVALADGFGSLWPAIGVLIVGVALELRYKMAWFNELYHRDRNPVGYWIGVASSVSVILVLVFISVWAQ